MDGNLIPGAFQMNTSWYHSALDEPLFEEHVHPNDEMVGFFGSDPENPDELNAIVDFALNGEMHRITKSCMIYVPGGMKHLPLSLVRWINRFSLLNLSCGKLRQRGRRRKKHL